MLVQNPEKIDITAVSCYITHKGKYLLLHRTKDDFWGSIAGSVEPHDKNLQAAIEREIFEELGLKIRPRFFKTVHHSINGKIIAYNMFEYDFKDDPSNAIKLNNENRTFGFFTLEEALELNLYEDEDYCLALHRKVRGQD